MDYDTILARDEGGIRWLTVNRPDKLNALNRAVIADLEKALAVTEAADEIRVLVITGAGEKAFVAGADIAEFSGLSAAGAQALSARGQRLFDRIEALGKPVIAAVNGYALGGGCELAMACHLRLASSNARFGQPEVKLGLIPGYGGTQRLPRLVGRGRALQLLLTGGMIDAGTALGWGLVNGVAEPGELRAAVVKMAGEIMAVSPAAVRRCLQAVYMGADLPLERAEAVEAIEFGLCATSEDFKEGVAAFLEKRPPAFPGR